VLKLAGIHRHFTNNGKGISADLSIGFNITLGSDHIHRSIFIFRAGGRKRRCLGMSGRPIINGRISTYPGTNPYQ
jgi:hypothetical protein